MKTLDSEHVHTAYRLGSIVVPIAELMGVTPPGSRFMPADKLGPGIVERADQEGRICVFWLDAEIEAWMDPKDLRPAGKEARIVSVYVLDAFGHSRRLDRSVDTLAGLTHNWTIQLLPDEIARAIRDDGWSWTFEYDPMREHMNRLHTVNVYLVPVPSDDEAEALTVAEMARAHLDIKQTARTYQWNPLDY